MPRFKALPTLFAGLVPAIVVYPERVQPTLPSPNVVAKVARSPGLVAR
jgi:hypothetical protein